MAENNVNKNIPQFNKNKGWAQFKKELELWQFATNIKKEKHGALIALSLNDDDETNLRQQVMDRVSLGDIQGEDGADKVIDILEKLLKQDDIELALQDFGKFEKEAWFRPGEEISTYLHRFDLLRNRLESHDMKMSPVILAFLLLHRTKFSNEEMMMVLTAVDFSKKDELYDQMKRALLKFRSPGITKSHISADTQPADVFASSNSKFKKTWKPVKGNLNPRGKDGRLMLCRFCGSFRHLKADCREAREVQLIQEEDEPEDLQWGGKQQHVLAMDPVPNHLLSETLNCAVLDTACPSTVAGQCWLDVYIDSLNDNLRSQVTHNKQNCKTFKFGDGAPLVAINRYRLPVYLAGQLVFIHVDIVPAEVPLLMSGQAMKDAGMVWDLPNDRVKIFGKTIDLEVTSTGHFCLPLWNDDCVVKDSNILFQTLTLDRKALLHLHRQFGHPSKERLKKLLTDSKSWSPNLEQIVSDIYDTCKICRMYKRTPSRPVVGLQLGHHFNDVVTMDLKQWDSRYILHMIDSATRYTISVFVRNKSPATIVDALLMNWVGIFGVMNSLMSDNGGEFNNDEVREVASMLNVKLKTSAAESPWQNGLNERNHYVTDQILKKLQIDFPQYRVDVLLKWANMARNSLNMVQGYSSHQLVFGLNPNLPNVFNDTLTSLEENTSSEKFAEHLNALKSARTAFIEAESSEKIRRALRARVRASERVFFHGDEVYYKRDSSERWLGPARVVFQDGKVVFIRHGGIYVKVSPSRIVRVESKRSVDLNPRSEDKSIVEDDSNVPNESKSKVTDSCGGGDDEGSSVGVQNDDQSSDSSGRSLRNLERRNYADMHSGKQIMATIIPKKEQTSEDCVQAKRLELEKLDNFGTYEIVDDEGQNCISTRWVVTKSGDVIKARLVARGFEDTEDVQSDSPTVGRTSIRILFCIAVAKGWTVGATDITSAYLQGNDMIRDVFVRPPKEAYVQGKIWKLKKCLYGLNDAARKFYDSVCEEMLRLRCEKSALDPSLFYLLNEKNIEGLMVSHIDDFLHAGNSSFDAKIMGLLRSRFVPGKVETKEFSYVGLDVKQSETNELYMNLNTYVDHVEIPDFAYDRSDSKSVLSPSEQSHFRALIGSVNWVVQNTRPDLAFELTDLSTSLKTATVGDLKRALKLIKDVKFTEQTILFPDLGDPLHWKIVVYTDAAFGNLCDGTGSTYGLLVFLVGNDRCAPLSWRAGKVKRVVRSTMAAEALALQEGLDEAYFLQHIIREMFPESQLPVIGFVDNRGLIEAIHSTSSVEDRKLRIDIACLKETLQKGWVETVRWCSGDQQLANVLTKKGASGAMLRNVLKTGKLNLMV